MSTERPRRIKRLEIETTQGHSASLFRESQFVLRYAEPALARDDLAISLSMPPRPEGYRANAIPPVLAMNLPEGFLLDRIMSLHRKVMVMDDMNLLALTSTPTAGRVWARMPDKSEGQTAAEPISLRDLLSAPGTEHLFEELVERYALNTAISGVQPKVVVPEARESRRRTGASPTMADRSSIHAPDLIVKAAGVEFPGLAENEFICMSMALAAGLEVPECWLSDDGSLFVIRRFDLGSDGGYLGFEDAASLTGRQPRDKYDATYAEVARSLADFCAPRLRAESLERFFRQLVFCCLIRNGDAHLKNWGVLYGDSSTADDDARLSPVYDLVCTTVWIKKDVLALSLAGSKSWPSRKALERFGGDHCALDNPGAHVDQVVDLAMQFSPRRKSAMWKAIRAEIEAAAGALARSRP